MTDRRIALAWVGGVLAVGSLLDIWLYCNLGNDSTISQAILWLSRKAPVVPMTFGWICGHFFWPGAKAGPLDALAWRWQPIAASVAAMIAAGWPNGTEVSDFLRSCSIAPFAIGFLCGHFLTPQTDIKGQSS